ncbi:OmpA family protein [Nocardia sp. NPDC057227]|uniref:OmpA family protein n=1 Tax=Nocardia sp. NPDC057227 TaxID=3346056 RepID=UPI003641AC7F
MKRWSVPLLIAAGALLAGCTTVAGTTSSGGGMTGTAMPPGCGSDPALGALVIAVAGHANSPSPEVSTEMVASMERAARHDTSIGIVGIDGDPRLVSATKFSTSAGNGPSYDDDLRQFLDGGRSAIGAVRAKEPHADYLRALQVSADAVRAGCPEGGQIVLQGAGLQDVPPVDFTADGLLDADPAEVAEFLRAHDSLPDLRGIRVVFNGIGETRAPQEKLDQASRNNLVAIWKAIAAAAGATDAVLDTAPRGREAPTDVPAVTPASAPAPLTFPGGCSIRDFRLPDAGPLGFQPNVAVFRDRQAASAVAGQLANAVQACPGARISLLGATSSFGELTPEGDRTRRDLSRERARAVAALLVASGVEAARIETAGDGYHFPGYVRDRDDQGVLLPGPAEQNRCVLVSVAR